MPTFDTFNLTRAQKIIATRADDDAARNLKFLNGDHYQGGDGWSGPMPKPTETGSTTTLAEIERAFVSRNAIGEVVGRHCAGILGRDCHWKFTPTRPLDPVEVPDPETGETTTKDGEPDDVEQALIAEAEQLLVQWWDKRSGQETLQSMVSALLATKRGVLRLYVPPGLRDKNGNIPAGDLAESLGRIWVQALNLNEDTLEFQMPSATVWTDKSTRSEIGVFTYKTTDTETGEPKDDEAELCYLDDVGNTVLRIVGKADEQMVVLPLGGRLTLFEATRQSLITPQIVSQQKLLNLAMTMKQHNVVLGGYLERILLNAQLPGQMERDANGVERFVPQPFYVGAGTTNALVGVKFTDANGNEQIATPSVVYRDPVPVDTFEATENAAYLAILQEAQQLHYALAGDAVVSGESRRQARDAFEKDLRLTAGKVEAAARWMLETALAMAAVFAGQPGRFDVLRADVRARVDSGPISADEIRTAQDMAGGLQLWSQEYAMSITGIEDVDAEFDRMEQEDIRRQNNPDKVLEREQLQLALEASRAAMQGDGFAQAQMEQQTQTTQGGDN